MSYPIAEEFAVVVAALLAGRCDGQEAIASLAAIHEREATKAREQGLAIAQHLLEKVRDYWDGRPLTHHGQHIHADLMDVLRAIAPAPTPDPAEVPAQVPGTDCEGESA